MRFTDLIEKKRDGHMLTDEEIQWFISNLSSLPDYQVSAMLMAIFLKGMSATERATLTLCMRESGEKLAFPGTDSRPIVDKHSTGGVGDKVSLPLAPLLACLGFRVPMISGRGLGITGGTLDKLESIPGFSTSIEAPKILEIVDKVGCIITGQTATMVPADKKLYALRDVTGTVASIDLICSSILSKKLAEGISDLILDVKFGEAAFMKTIDEARQLAHSLADIAADTGVSCRAVVNSMDEPLGRTAGNLLEVKETLEILEGKGVADIVDVVLACATHLLLMTGKASSESEASKMASDCLASGKPLEKFFEMVKAQGGDIDQLRSLVSEDSTANFVSEVRSASGGIVQRCSALAIGEVVRDLGGGRKQQSDVVDFSVGIDRIAKAGETVKEGDILCRMHCRSGAEAQQHYQRVLSAFSIGPDQPEQLPRIREIVHGVASTPATDSAPKRMRAL